MINTFFLILIIAFSLDVGSTPLEYTCNMTVTLPKNNLVYSLVKFSIIPFNFYEGVH